MSYIKKLAGDKIFLSPQGTTEDEVLKFSGWMNDFGVTDYIGRSSNVVSIPAEREYLENSSKGDPNKRAFNIVNGQNEVIGTTSLEKINWINRNAKLGIFIGDENYRNKGFGTEAVRLLLEYGFRYLNLHSISLTVLANNERARKCYTKCGFKEFGTEKEGTFLNGKYYDRVYMQIMDNEFEGDFIRNKNVQ